MCVLVVVDFIPARPYSEQTFVEKAGGVRGGGGGGGGAGPERAVVIRTPPPPPLLGLWRVQHGAVEHVGDASPHLQVANSGK